MEWPLTIHTVFWPEHICCSTEIKPFILWETVKNSFSPHLRSSKRHILYISLHYLIAYWLKAQNSSLPAEFAPSKGLSHMRCHKEPQEHPLRSHPNIPRSRACFRNGSLHFFCPTKSATYHPITIYGPFSPPDVEETPNTNMGHLPSPIRPYPKAAIWRSNSDSIFVGDGWVESFPKFNRNSHRRQWTTQSGQHCFRRQLPLTRRCIQVHSVKRI